MSIPVKKTISVIQEVRMPRRFLPVPKTVSWSMHHPMGDRLGPKFSSGAMSSKTRKAIATVFFKRNMALKTYAIVDYSVAAGNLELHFRYGKTSARYAEMLSPGKKPGNVKSPGREVISPKTPLQAAAYPFRKIYAHLLGKSDKKAEAALMAIKESVVC